MEPDTIALLAVNALAWAVLAGVGWNRLTAHQLRQEDMLEKLYDLDQRMRNHEQWRARLEGELGECDGS
jgi:hypothetical protein